MLFTLQLLPLQVVDTPTFSEDLLCKIGKSPLKWKYTEEFLFDSRPQDFITVKQQGHLWYVIFQVSWL